MFLEKEHSDLVDYINIRLAAFIQVLFPHKKLLNINLMPETPSAQIIHGGYDCSLRDVLSKNI